MKMADSTLPTVVVSGVASGAGKTSLATAVIEYLKNRTRMGAVKITVTHGEQGCPHGGKSCNVCSSLGGDFQILARREVIEQSGSDTARFAQAGADPVLWGITRDVAIVEMWAEMTGLLANSSCVVIESNTLAIAIEPCLSLMIVDPTVSRRLWKRSATSLIATADLLIFNDRGTLTQRETTMCEVRQLRTLGETITIAHPNQATANLLLANRLNRLC